MMPRKHTRCLIPSLLSLLLVCLFPWFADAESVMDWVSDNAIPFVTASVVSNSSDLECLLDLIGDARVVALGEQTHGTSEFQTMKHRIIQFLVEEMGFTALVVEGSWGGGLMADRYVIEGRGSLSNISLKLGPWFFQSEEFQDLVGWMREYNASSPESPVHLVGMDYQGPHRALDWCESILAANGHALSSSASRLLDRIPYAAQRFWSGSPDDKQEYFDRCQPVIDYMLGAMPEFEEDLTELEIAAILRIPQAIEYLKERVNISVAENSPNAAGWYPLSFDFRDRCMAETVSWWLDALGENAKIIIWAHNGHIATNWPEAGLVPLGHNLASRFQEDFISIGFSTCSGTFSAFNAEIGALVDDLVLPEPTMDSYESVFCATSIDNFFLDLRDLQPGSVVDAWMNQSQGFKVLGGDPIIVNGRVISAFDTKGSLPNMFDIVIHIANTTSIHY